MLLSYQCPLIPNWSARNKKANSTSRSGQNVKAALADEYRQNRYDERAV